MSELFINKINPYYVCGHYINTKNGCKKVHHN